MGDTHVKEEVGDVRERRRWTGEWKRGAWESKNFKEDPVKMGRNKGKEGREKEGRRTEGLSAISLVTLQYSYGVSFCS